MTIIEDETWNKFKRHCLSQQQLNPESTIPETIRKLQYLEKKGLDLQTSTKDQIYDHFATRLEHGATYSALNHYVKALNRWHKFLGSGFEFDLYKTEKKPMKVPTTAEINALLQCCSKKNRFDRRNKLIILLLAKTGMRNKELCNLKLTDIDWQRHEITIQNSKHNKTRIIPIEHKLLYGTTYPSLKNYIDHWRIDSSKQYVFTTEKGKMTPNYLRQLIKTIAKRSGMHWLHPHSFRHYAATNILRAGINIRIVQEILGHSSIKTTGGYLHVIENDLRQAIENPNIEDPVIPSTKHWPLLAKTLLK
jgi:integrase/recombinase XerD